MMKNRFSKIAVVLLSAILLIGAVIGVTAFADGAPSVEIARKNISYDGAVRILYAVDAQNAGDNTIEVRFYDANDNLLYTKAPTNTITLGETTYDVVFSNGIDPLDLRKSVFAVPVLVNGAGEVVAEGAAVEYSPYIYAMNRFDKEYADDQYALYTALLNYGAAVQRFFSDADTVAANGGYADAYYNVTVNAALASDLEETFELFAGAFSALDLANGAITADADMGDDLPFRGYADVDGKIFATNPVLSAANIKPGTNTVLAIYGYANKNQGVYYNDAAAAGTRYDMTSMPTVANTDAANTILAIEDGALKLNVAGTKESGFSFAKDLTVAPGAKLIVEFDVLYNGCQNPTNDNNSRIYFGLVTNTRASYNDFVLPHKWFTVPDGNAYAFNKTFDNSRLTGGEWANFRIEYEVKEDGSAVYTGFINNKQTYTQNVAATAATAFKGFGILGNSSSISEWYFDNFYMGVQCAEHNYGEFATVGAHQGNGVFKKSCSKCGATLDETFTVTSGNGKFFNASYATGAKVDFTNMGSFELRDVASSSTGMTYGVADGVYNVAITNYDIVALEPAGHYGYLTLNANKTYAVEFDMKYSGELTADRQVYFGANCKVLNQTGNTAIIGGSKSIVFGNEIANFDFDYTNSRNNAMIKDVWYNVRYEIVVDDTRTNAQYLTYLNDQLIGTSTATLDDTYKFLFGIILQGRDYAGDTLTLSFDNMFMGEVVEPLELGTGKYYSDANYEGTRNDMSTNAQIALGNSANATISYTDDDTLKVYNTTAGEGGVGIRTKDGSRIQLATGETIVVEFDFKYNGCQNPSSSGKFYFGLSTGTAWNYNNMGVYGDNAIKWVPSSNDYMTYGDVKINRGAWVNYRIEYTLNGDGTALYTTYINDEAVITKTLTTTAASFTGLLIYCAPASIIDVEIDNFFIGKVAPEAPEAPETGNGKYFSDANATGSKADIDNTAIAKVWDVSTKTGVTHSAVDGTYNLHVVDEDGITLAPQGGSTLTLGAGQTYVFEFDFKFTGTLTADRYIYAGPAYGVTTNSNMYPTSGFGIYFRANGTADFILATGVSLNKDTWYNIRYELSLAADGTTPKYEIFVDDVSIYTYTDFTISNAALYGFYMQPKSGQTANGDLDLYFDNLYVGVH